MKNVLRNWLRAALALALLLNLSSLAAAQVTTGSINGVVTDESGGVLPGATIMAVHGPTGTKYTAVSGAKGRYDILNVRVGGPYTVAVAMPGFKTATVNDLNIALGATVDVPFKLAVASLTETVEVVSDAGALINSTRTGPASNVAQEAIENMPTVSRSITDMARLSPHFTPLGNGGGDGADVLSVGGRSARYNNVQIDGANNNDLFALAGNSGNPGGVTATQPISFDAIAEIQLVVAPYDVRQGGFSGGGINAITRSGTNEFHGTAMYEWRSQSLVGDSAPTYSYNTGQQIAASRPLSTFSEKQATFSLGGPIKKDKAFFFINADFSRNKTPVGWSADGSSGQTFTVPKADLDRYLSILKNQYGYDPSAGVNTLGEYIRETPSNKVLVKLDFNLSDKHRLTLRNNYTQPKTDVGFPNNANFKTPDNYYQVNNTSNSTVAQLNSTLGKGVNELRVNFQTIKDIRDGIGAFPSIRVDLTPAVCGSATCFITSGREAFSGANELRQKVFELTDDYTFHKGNHEITIGTHDEFFHFENLFIRDNFGTYRFSSLDNFAAGVAQQYDYSFSATSDPRQAAKFSVHQFGLYSGDLWRVKPNFTINYGVRVDIPSFPDKPTANPAAVANFGYATDTVPAPKMWSPRAGFNWDVSGDAKSQLRGGLGVFAGRPPYVWLSNQYGNTGVDFTRIGAAFNTASRIPFVADPKNQPKTVTGAAAGTFTNEIDLVDPDFKYPQILRSNLAYDRQLGFWGLVGTVEGIYGKTLQDIDYQNLNFVKTAQTRVSDGRPIFTKKVSTLSDVIFLTNTTQGKSWTVSGKLERPFRHNFYFSTSYLYGKSYSVNDGGSDQAASNFANNLVPGDSNAAPLTESRFSPGHRVNASASYNIKLAKKMNLTLSGYYNGQSGRPYTYLFTSDINGDSKTGNDLVYYPKSATEVNFTNGTYEQFDTYMQAAGAGKYKGQVIPKNSLRGPWTNGLDLSASLKVPFNKRTVEFKADLLNALNLMNQSWGEIDYALFNALSPIGVSIDTATGKYNYNIATINLPTYIKYNRDDLRSRWQAAFSARVRF
jgi:hypothetical protein